MTDRRSAALLARLHYPAQRLLAVCALVLVPLIVFAWLSGSPWRAPEALLPDPSSLAAQALDAAPARPDAADIIAARPLFAQNRRPPPPEPPKEEKKAPDLLDQAKLVGVLGSGHGSVALLHTGEGAKRLRIGDSLNGWRFARIDARGAAFERQAGDRENPRTESRQLPFVRVPLTVIGQPPRVRR